jgi:site-specific DNA recombinase
MNAIIYCRVSTDRQMNEGHGIDSQEKRCKDWCIKNNHEVNKIFRDEGVSGSIGDRPAVREMLEYLSKNPHTIVVIDDIKRLARDVQVFLLLKESIQSLNCTIHYLNHSFEDSPEGQFIQTILAGAAQLERQQNARQVKQKMKSRLEDGYWVFNQIVGYKYQIQNGNKILTQTDKAPIIKEMFEKLANLQLINIAEAHSFLISKGLKMSKSQIYLIVQDIKYAGYIEYSKWGIPIIKGKHDPIISLDLFYKVQEILKQRGKAYQSKHEDEFILRGRVCCSQCGKKLTSYFAKGKKKYFAYYTCKNQGCDVKDKVIPREKIESEFVDILKKVKPTEQMIQIFENTFKQLWEDKTKLYKKEKENLQRELNLIQAESKRTIDKITKTDSYLVQKALESKLEELEKNRIITSYKIETTNQPKGNFLTPLKLVIDFVKNLDKMWENGSKDERQIVFNLVFKQDLVYDLNLGFLTPSISSLYSAFQSVSTSDFYFGGLNKTNFEHLINEIFEFGKMIELQACNSISSWS